MQKAVCVRLNETQPGTAVIKFGAEQFYFINSLTSPDMRALDIGDVNGDGKVDLVVAGSVGGGQFTATFLGNGDGTFARLDETLTSLGDIRQVALRDVNGDGKLDHLRNVYRWAIRDDRQGGRYIFSKIDLRLSGFSA